MKTHNICTAAQLSVVDTLERRVLLSALPGTSETVSEPLAAVHAPLAAKMGFRAQRTIGVDAQSNLQAEKSAQKSGVETKGKYVWSLNNGDYLRFNRVRFSEDIKSVQVRMAVPAKQRGQVIEFRLGSPKGRLLGKLVTESAGDGKAFWTQSTPVRAASGTHNLYVVFKGKKDVGRIDYIRFSSHRHTRIMLLGDSITESRGGHDSYRRPLWKQLEKAGYSVNFTGTRRGLAGRGDPTAYDFDQDHEGHTGYRAEGILNNIDSWLKAQPVPDIVVIHAGTNDLLARQTPESTVAEISQIIDRLRARNPKVTILLAEVVPSTWNPDWMTEQTNTGLIALAVEKNTDRSPVILVDQATGFDPAVDTFNGLHPSASGERKIAGRFFQALKSILP